jgi:choline dehydrogenase-like flavoprotein
MRISWLTAQDITRAREALHAAGADWEAHFAPAFTAPPAPDGIDRVAWDRLTEHVARAERVSEVVRVQGLETALARFRGSGIAVEAATLVAAARMADAVDYELVADVLRARVDEHLFYAPFLEMLIGLGRSDMDRAVGEFEAFADAYKDVDATVADWSERVAAIRDGLADAYVTAGRLDQAEALFAERHAEDTRDVAVALSASRAFLAAGAISHAVHWLGIGATRAHELGRAAFAQVLRDKQTTIRKRLS